MENTASKYFCPRLVDYIAIVGARKYNGDTCNASTSASIGGHISSSNVNTGTSYAASISTASSSTGAGGGGGSSSSSSSYSVQMPELLRRYPPEDHKDFPLPPDVVFFCQPEGCFFVKAKRSAVRETNTFVFTLMEKDTNRIRYGVVLNFYRPVERKKSTGAGSGSGCHSSTSISNRPSPIPPQGDMDKHQQQQQQHYQPQQQVDTQIGLVSDTEVNRTATTTTSSHFNESPVIRTKKQSNMSCLTSLCLLSHHPFFSTFRECLFVLKRLIDVCSERNCARKSPTSHHGKRY